MAGISNSPPRPTSFTYLVSIVVSTSAFGLLMAGCGAQGANRGGGGSGLNDNPSCSDICNPACVVYSPGACGVVAGGGTGAGTGTGTGTTSVGSCSDACDASCSGYDAGACDGGGIGDGGCDLDTCGDRGTTVGDPGDGGGDPGIGDGGGDGGGDTGVGDGGGDYGGGDPGDGGGGDPGDGGGDPGDGGWDGGVAHPGNGAHPAIMRGSGSHASSLQLRDTLPGFSPRELAKAKQEGK